nr:MAG TPA: Rho termination factor, N-terminal domain [Caudoviricetes sp.]
MKYPHIVVLNGKWYNAGEEVPDNTEASFEYSKTAINRMSTADLQSFAVEQGVENAEELTGAELKKLLIEKLGL